MLSFECQYGLRKDFACCNHQPCNSAFQKNVKYFVLPLSGDYPQTEKHAHVHFFHWKIGATSVYPFILRGYLSTYATTVFYFLLCDIFRESQGKGFKISSLTRNKCDCNQSSPLKLCKLHVYNCLPLTPFVSRWLWCRDNGISS